MPFGLYNQNISASHRCKHGCRSGEDSFVNQSVEPSYAQDTKIVVQHLQVTVFAHVKRPCSTLVLDGVGFFEVKVKVLDHAEDQYQWDYDGKKVRITWKEQLPVNSLRKIQINYNVVRPITGMVISVPNEQYPNRKTYAVTDHETERARYWLVCIDSPISRPSLEIWLTAPSKYTSLANGTLLSDTTSEGGKRTTYWKLEEVCPSYLVCVAVGDFVCYDDGLYDNRVPVKFFASEGTPLENLQISFGLTKKMLGFIEKTLGNKFPFPKYYQIVLSRVAGAMENISLTTWDTPYLVDAVRSKEHQRIVDMINFHELSHSFFGDSIVIRHFEHAWLKESWATYMQWNWLKFNNGNDEFQYELLRDRDSYVSECSQYIRPIVTKKYDSSWHLFDEHLYPGGAWRLKMLNAKLGDVIFWEAVQDYVAKYSGHHVETDDFRKILENHSRLNLTKFFDQWIYGRGYPVLKGDFKFDSEKSEVKLILEQVQENTQIFDIELEVNFVDKNGRKYNQTVTFDGKRGVTVFKTDCEVTLIEIDPEIKLLFTIDLNPGDQILKNVFSSSATVPNRIWAAKELIKDGSLSNLLFLSEAYGKEPFWGVRAEIVKNLIEFQSSSDSVGLIAKILLSEKEATAQVSMLLAMRSASIRSSKMRQTIVTFLAQKDLTYRATGLALIVLSNQRDLNDYNVVKSFCEDQSYQFIVRSFALEAIGNFRTTEGYQFLKSKVRFGDEKEEARPEAIIGFAKNAFWLGKTQQQEAIEYLIDVLQEEDFHSWIPFAKRAAIKGLVLLEDSSCIPHLEALKSRHDKQEHRTIDVAIKKLKGNESSQIIEMKKEISDLTTKLNKLETVLQDFMASKK